MKQNRGFYFILFSAKYLENGSTVKVEPNGGLLDAVRPMDFLPGFSLEGFPNRFIFI